MKKILAFIFISLFLISGNCLAQEYKANIWASWASITTAVKWTFPYKSREITIINGSAIPVCISFNDNTPTPACTSAITNQSGTGDNRTFQMQASNNITLRDISQQSINIISMGAAASPVSVVVAY
jgi:hypothetical protein